jgi:exopolysaccharide production protein ExoQ
VLRGYYLASTFYLMQVAEAFSILDVLAYGAWEGKPGDKITQGLNLLFNFTSLVLFRWGFSRTRRIGVGGNLALAVTGFLLLSALWSFAPEATVRRGIIYLFAVVGAIGVAGTLDVDEFMEVLGLSCAFSGAASLLLLAISPGNAVDLRGDFHGIFPHKNVLGQAMTAGALASLHAIRVGRKRASSAVMLILFIVVALLSKSATSFMIIFAFCGSDGIIAIFRKGGAARVMAIGATVILLPAVAFAALFPDSLLQLIGKDPTLTGRTELWAYVLADIAKKPLLGWGYAGFWQPSNPAQVEISMIVKWYVPQAHNGLLEMLLDVGTIGTALFIFLWARNVWLALQCLRTPEKALAISSFFSCAGIFLVGISESVLMEPLQIATSLFFITGLMCERAVRAAATYREGNAMGGFFAAIGAAVGGVVGTFAGAVAGVPGDAAAGAIIGGAIIGGAIGNAIGNVLNPPTQ